MKQQGLLIWGFYRRFGLFTVLISLGAWGVVELPLGVAFVRFLPAFLLLKIATGALVWYLQRTFYPHTYFFYANLGFSERRLYLIAFGLDLLLFLAFVLLVHLTKHFV